MPPEKVHQIQRQILRGHGEAMRSFRQFLYIDLDKDLELALDLTVFVYIVVDLLHNPKWAKELM